MVTGINKNPNGLNKEWYSTASYLYSAILHNTINSIRLLNIHQIEDFVEGGWYSIFNNGHFVSIYTKQLPGQSMITFHSFKEFDEFFKNKDKNQYEFVLTYRLLIAEFLSCFNTRRMRETCNMGLSD